jgi:hypothetical protein
MLRIGFVVVTIVLGMVFIIAVTSSHSNDGRPAAITTSDHTGAVTSPDNYRTSDPVHQMGEELSAAGFDRTDASRDQPDLRGPVVTHGAR